MVMADFHIAIIRGSKGIGHLVAEQRLVHRIVTSCKNTKQQRGLNFVVWKLVRSIEDLCLGHLLRLVVLKL